MYGNSSARIVRSITTLHLFIYLFIYVRYLIFVMFKEVLKAVMCHFCA